MAVIIAEIKGDKWNEVLTLFFVNGFEEGCFWRYSGVYTREAV